MFEFIVVCLLLYIAYQVAKNNDNDWWLYDIHDDMMTWQSWIYYMHACFYMLYMIYWKCYIYIYLRPKAPVACQISYVLGMHYL